MSLASQNKADFLFFFFFFDLTSKHQGDFLCGSRPDSLHFSQKNLKKKFEEKKKKEEQSRQQSY